MKIPKPRHFATVLFWALALSLLPAAHAQIVGIAHSFASVPGASPSSGLVLGGDGNFYGTTSNGGNTGNGAVFVITPSGSESVIFSFNNSSATGSGPRAGLLADGGTLYGTTLSGGSHGRGTIFKITAPGAATTLYSFGSQAGDGSGPTAGLIKGSDGNFYGVTTGGGSHSQGTVFKMTPSGAETVLYSFGTNLNDGGAPLAALLQASDGNFYGTTSSGGAFELGTVFKITPAGALTTLWAFGSGGDGADPQGALIQGGEGNLYGTTFTGGSENEGVVFQITPTGIETVLYSFGTNAGESGYPESGLTLGNDGNFYGTETGFFGAGAGTVFKITPSGSETVLYSFAGGPADGGFPQGALALGNDGNFYGTTLQDGALAEGTVFQVTPLGVETVLYSFGSATDGSIPLAGLVQGNDNNLYGTTSQGGASNQGTVFTYYGAETVLYSFGSSPNDGLQPAAPLVLASDGNFYGATPDGGSFNGGTVFKVTSGGAESVFYNFGSSSNDGVDPMAGLFQGSDGNFYGTTKAGGSQGAGTVFQITPSASETPIYSFASPGAGSLAFPSGLVQGSDGNFYGTTYSGGSHGSGTVFQVTPEGSETVLYNFGAIPNDGANPNQGLALGSDGNFYGMTQFGGSAFVGTVFKVTPAGIETVLHSFGANLNDGANPIGGLAQGGDGNFYGATWQGGSQNLGAIFKITPSGAETVLYNFSKNAGDGANPVGALTFLPSNNYFYGTTQAGGTGGAGVIYNFYGLNAEPQAPFVTNKNVLLTNGTPVTINVLANAFDPDHLTLTVASVTHPSLGRAVINSDNTVTYIPNESFAKYSGTDSFRYTVTNGAASATCLVTIGNAFYPQKGSFAGVNGGGYLTLTTTNTGAFTGKFRTGNVVYSLKGQFDANGMFMVSINGELLVLQMDVTDLSGGAYGNDTISGVYNGFGLTAYHAVYNSATNPAPQAGYYTMLLPANDPADTTVPAGAGYATMKVSESGAVAITGLLADGTGISDGGYITGDGTNYVNQTPLYIALSYKTAGSLTGYIVFEDETASSDCDGMLTWSKPLQAKPGLYKPGFTTVLSAVGSRYAPPATGELALDLSAASPNATVSLSEGDLPSALLKLVTVTVGSSSVDNVSVNNPGADQMTLSLKTNSGLFSGAFVSPATNKSTKLQGVLFPKRNLAQGWFVGPAHSGAVTLAPH